MSFFFICLKGGSNKNISEETNGHFTQFFSGCITNIYFHNKRQPLQIQQATKGLNVHDCTGQL